MAITAIEWLKSKSLYPFEEVTYKVILDDRGVEDYSTPHLDLTVKQKNLMEADLIFVAVMMSPSSIGAYSVSHAGFNKSVGGAQTTYVKDKINFALKIYAMYDDPKYELLKPNNVIKVLNVKDKV